MKWLAWMRKKGHWGAHDPEQAKMAPWTDHLAELRRRIIRVLIFFVVAFISSFVFSERIVHWLRAGARVQVEWNVFAPTDALQVWLKVAFITSLVVVIPYLLFELWLFVRPGLTKRERRITLRYIPLSSLLFLGGLSFAYFVLFPLLLRFMQHLADRLDAQQLYGVSQYFSFMFRLVLPIGLLFELPILILFLTQLGIIDPQLLRRIRKVAYLVLVIVGTALTPPDIVSDLMVILPLIVLYEISVGLSSWSYRRKMKAREEEERLEELP